MSDNYETRGVLTGAYRACRPSRRINARMLTHTVRIARDYQPGDSYAANVVALCRVKATSLADGPPSDLAQSEPTCTTCRRRDPRFKVSEKPPRISDIVVGGKVIDLMDALKKSLEPR